MTFVSDLRPRELWQHFDQILTIPRGSKNEATIRKYVISIADKNGLSCRQDGAGNLVVLKPGAPGKETNPLLILQSHLDMVNEKNAEVIHDFEKDPIQPRRDGDYVKATGTTLGADNGIGVATQLAVLESPDIEHGPLELLFTVDEETGLTGAAALEPGFLKGTRLLNLDTEEEGAIYVGCAGGAGIDLTLVLDWEPTGGEQVTLQVHLTGLNGGHSGVDIHRQRGNAIKILARALAAVETTFRLAEIRGGNMRNAIPREASAVLSIPRLQEPAFRDQLNEVLARATEEVRMADPEMRWEITQVAPADSVLRKASNKTAIDLLNALPHGVTTMSYEIPELVETSSNVATAEIQDGRLGIHVSNRSSVASALEALSGQVSSIGRLAGASVAIGEAYPGWQPNLDSQLLRSAQRVFLKQRNEAANVKAVHGGLECGLIGETFPGMDMISIGPQIEFPHSPDEQVKIDSVSEFWETLVAILEDV